MILNLIRSNLKKFKPYRSARSLYRNGLLLDANENPYGKFNRYPDSYSAVLRKKIASYLGVSKKNIFVGNGSDEIIDLLIRLFVNPKESVLIFQPTYGMYEVLAKIADAAVIKCPLDRDFQINFVQFERRIRSDTKIIFSCSPNNPTGNLLRWVDIEKLCRGFSGIVVVDEAYIEFASRRSLAKKVRRFPNLIVLRTFSKAWGLAGIRAGYAIANTAIVGYLDRIKLPYNLNIISSRIAVRTLGRKNIMLRNRRIILRERKKLLKKLLAFGFDVFPSEANFLLVKKVGASSIFKQLVKKFGIVTRQFPENSMLKDCLRISIGTPRQNRALLKSLSKIL